MTMKFHFRHMDPSPFLKAYAERKLGGEIQKFSKRPVTTVVHCEVEALKHRVSIEVTEPDGFNFFVSQKADTMYEAVDGIALKLAARLRKHKEKIRQHRHRRIVKSGLARLMRELTSDVEFGDHIVDAGDIVSYERVARTQYPSRAS